MALVGVAAACTAGSKPADTTGAANGFEVYYAAGSRDGAGRYMGGTELRNLASHQGKLYAGNGYWEDRPGSEGRQGAAILVLEGPAQHWKIDHVFDERLPDGRRRDFAVSAIAAYNDMTTLSDARLGDVVLIGLEAFIPPGSPKPAGHTILDVVNGLEGGAWYLVRHGDGRYDVHQVDAVLPRIGRALVATRAIQVSPFPNDDALYFAGYDANGTAAHDTAWIVRATPGAARHGQP